MQDNQHKDAKTYHYHFRQQNPRRLNSKPGHHWASLVISSSVWIIQPTVWQCGMQDNKNGSPGQVQQARRLEAPCAYRWQCPPNACWGASPSGCWCGRWPQEKLGQPADRWIEPWMREGQEFRGNRHSKPGFWQEEQKHPNTRSWRKTTKSTLLETRQSSWPKHEKTAQENRG